MSTYLKFIEGKSPSGKTKVLMVRSELTDDLLGEIRWWGAWRKYAFLTLGQYAILDTSCMREICEKIDSLMAERRG